MSDSDLRERVRAVLFEASKRRGQAAFDRTVDAILAIVEPLQAERDAAFDQARRCVVITTELRECKRCGGLRAVAVSHDHTDYHGPCPDCHGTGRTDESGGA